MLDNLLGIDVAGDVMAVANVAADEGYAVVAIFKGAHNEARVDTAQTHHTDDSKVRRVLKLCLFGSVLGDVANRYQMAIGLP